MKRGRVLRILEQVQAAPRGTGELYAPSAFQPGLLTVLSEALATTPAFTGTWRARGALAADWPRLRAPGIGGRGAPSRRPAPGRAV
jgi:hypothetical protein